MRIFLDTANIEHIRHAVKLGVISGVTTNPSLVAREKGIAFKDAVLEICSLRLDHVSQSSNTSKPTSFSNLAVRSSNSANSASPEKSAHRLQR